MISRLRRPALLAPAAILWISMLPLVLMRADSSPVPAQVRVAHVASARPATAEPRAARVRAARAARTPVYVGRDGARITPARLRRFLVRNGSPMAGHAETLVASGIRHGMDPRSVVAIAGAESGFGTVMACYNAWGWDRGACRWSSWTQAITAYTRLIADAYPSLGRGDFATAGRRYNPGNWAAWAAKCRAYFRSI